MFGERGAAMPRAPVPQVFGVRVLEPAWERRAEIVMCLVNGRLGRIGGTVYLAGIAHPQVLMVDAYLQVEAVWLFRRHYRAITAIAWEGPDDADA